MTEAGLLYSNARIKSMENSLVSPLQMGRLLDCETFSDAVKMLSEFGYTGGTAADDGVSYENLLDAERAAATDFFKENVFKKSGLETMLLPADWHNLKSALKAKYGKVKDLSLLVYQGGNVDLETIEKAANGDEEAASGLTTEMNETIAATRAEFAENPPSGRFIDVVADKAMYREIFAILKKSSSPCLVKYFALQVDLLNLKNFYRSKRLRLGKEEFREGFISGGKLKETLFSEGYETPDEDFAKQIEKVAPEFLKITKVLSEGKIAEAEAMADNMQLKIFKDDRNDMFSVAPIAGFYLAKLTEIKSVKLILAAKKNGVDKQQLRVRLRELYA